MLEWTDYSLSRDRSQHKKARVNVFGGSAKSPGAAYLSAEAAQRVGAGYVRLYFSDFGGSRISLREASFQYHPQWKWSDLEAADAVVCGPGGVPKNFQKLLRLAAPQVYDASALVSEKFWFQKKSEGFRILTPHPGEAARMLKVSVEEILGDELGAAQELSRRTQSAVYLKSQPAFLVFPDREQYYVNLSLHPGFGTAGSGDVLAGILGGHLALQAKNPEEAVISSIAFQQALGREMGLSEGWISSDQLGLFQAAFRRLRKRGRP
jgi:NAD(P)H-hydrate epimerase